MRILKLVAAAAIAFGTMGALSVPTPGSTVEAQRHWRGDGHRHDWRGDRGYRGRGDERGRHWRGYRGRHYGWRNRRVCRWVWRHGLRDRVCRWVRVRYWR